MLQKPKSCFGCPLQLNDGGFSIPEGKCKTGVLIVGEALGDKEKYAGLPFRPEAEAGSSLQTAIRLLGYEREHFGLWNMIACQPPFNNLENTKYEYEAIEHCKVHFKMVLDQYKPKVILALGNVPLKHLIKLDPATIAYQEELKLNDPKQYKAYQKNFKISSLRGYILPSIYNIPIIPSLHPSYITREGRIYIGVLMRDIRAAVDYAAGKIPKFTHKYIIEPTIQQAEEFYQDCKAHPELAISHDIETPYTILETDESEVEYENIEVRAIDSIQFSIREGEAIFFPWFGEFIEIARKILALLNPKVGWNNWGFDKVHIEYALGKNSIKGLNIDAMWEWKWLNQDFVKIGRSLQFATNFHAPNFPAWKYLAQIDPKLYGCFDPDAALRNYYGIKKILESFRLLPDSKSLWDGFIDDVVKLRPILDDITKRGFPINQEERLKFKTQIDEEQKKILSELQNAYPQELTRFDPEVGYKRIPNEVFEVDELFKKASDIKNDGPFYIVENEELYNFRKAQYLEEHTRKDRTTGLIVREFEVDGEKIKRYCRAEEFKPNGRDQVIEYLKFKKYKVPTKRDRKTGEVKETSSKDELYHIAEEVNDPFINKVVYYRELDHLGATYVGRKTINKKTGKVKITGWQTGSDSRIHAEFLFLPATGQLSTSPNVQNAPARGTKFSSPGYAKLAKQFRKMVAAGPGKVLLSADWSAFHALTLAFEAEDAAYMRVVRLDPHSFIAAHILSEDIPMKLMKLKKKRPDNLDEIEWKRQIAVADEALDRLKTLHTWLALPDLALGAHLKWFKNNYKFVRDSQAKPALLGMGFGMGIKKFYKLNRHTFRSEAEPKRIIDLARKLFPKTFVDYHKTIKKLADRQTYLISRYGYIRRFFDVFDWRLHTGYTQPKYIYGQEIIRKANGQWWVKKDGIDAEAAIAYLPSNDAFAFKKECMRNLWEHPNGNLCQAYGLVNEIHDDLLFEIDENLVSEAIINLKNVMEAPAKYLRNSTAPQGLITRVEMKVGKNWAEMENV